MSRRHDAASCGICDARSGYHHGTCTWEASKKQARIHGGWLALSMLSVPVPVPVPTALTGF